MTEMRRDAHAAPPRFDGLGAVVINTTLKRSPEPGNTDGLAATSRSRASMTTGRTSRM